MDSEDKKMAAVEAATRRLHETMADSKEERRLLREEREKAAAVREDMRTLFNGDLRALIQKRVDEQMDQLNQETEAVLDRSIKKLQSMIHAIATQENFTRLVAREIIERLGPDAKPYIMGDGRRG